MRSEPIKKHKYSQKSEEYHIELSYENVYWWAIPDFLSRSCPFPSRAYLKNQGQREDEGKRKEKYN